MSPILQVNHLKVHYSIVRNFQKRRLIKALDGISFSLDRNKTLGIVGESGCGKSTLARSLMGLERPTEGSILYEGQPVELLSRQERSQSIQMIFQDPYSSLNPRKPAWKLVAEPLFINTSLSRKECYERALFLMEKVGLRSDLAHCYSHMFSGGQRQRLGIARALSLEPRVLICDEPVSALDISIQAQVLNLLMDLQDEMGHTYIFISHDLNVVSHMSDQIIVMYFGQIVEQGERDEIFFRPQHPYTKALIASSPKLRNEAFEAEPIYGEVPSLFHPPLGCTFYKRCPVAKDDCFSVRPQLELKRNRRVACLNVSSKWGEYV